MILMLGDVHGKFRHVTDLVKKHKPAAVIFLGDIEPQQPFELEIKDILTLTEVYFIHGNHDTDNENNYRNLYLSGLSNRNIHGRVVEIDGLKVAGLGGVFRKYWYPVFDINDEPQVKNYNGMLDYIVQKDYMREKAVNRHTEVPVGQAMTHMSTIFYDEWLNLAEQKADILVTHEAPSCHPNGFYGIDALARFMEVDLTFHGHQHDRLDYSNQFDKLGFKAHGVGFRGATDQDGNLILNGEYDDDIGKTSRQVKIDGEIESAWARNEYLPNLEKK